MFLRGLQNGTESPAFIDLLRKFEIDSNVLGWVNLGRTSHAKQWSTTWSAPKEPANQIVYYLMEGYDKPAAVDNDALGTPDSPGKIRLRVPSAWSAPSAAAASSPSAAPAS